MTYHTSLKRDPTQKYYILGYSVARTGQRRPGWVAAVVLALFLADMCLSMIMNYTMMLPSSNATPSLSPLPVTGRQSLGERSVCSKKNRGQDSGYTSSLAPLEGIAGCSVSPEVTY